MLRGAHTLGAVPPLFGQRRASARGTESRGDRASPGPGAAPPGRTGGAGSCPELCRVFFVSDAPVRWRVREQPPLGAGGRLCSPEPCGTRGSCLCILECAAGPSCGPAGRTFPWRGVTGCALVGGTGSRSFCLTPERSGTPPCASPCHKVLGDPHPTLVILLPVCPLSSPAVLLYPRNHHTASSGSYLDVSLVAFRFSRPRA